MHTTDEGAAAVEWVVEFAWQCERHGWNTCPLTPTALRFSDEPCCERAVAIASRSVQRKISEPLLPTPRSTTTAGV